MLGGGRERERERERERAVLGGYQKMGENQPGF
jgi:hypothetical protein